MAQDTSLLGRAVRASLLISLAAATAAGCGGGGGGRQSVPPSTILPPPPPPPPPGLPPLPPQIAPPSFFETTEYLGSGFQSSNRSGLGQIGASTAYSRGATGQGITVAVIDTNVDTSISELDGQISGTFDVRAAARSASDIDADGHGTMVSSVIVARKNDIGVHGVAYEAKVLAIRADTPGSCQTTGEDEGCKFNDSTLITAINYAVSQGAKVINLSLGGEDGSQISTGLRNAMANATSQGVLFAIAAGNEGEPPTASDPAKGLNPTEPAIVAGTSAMNGLVVAVGAVDRNGVMPAFSNRAGSTADYYLLAPGVSIIMAGVDDDVRLPNNPTCSAQVTTGCNDADSEGDYWSGSGTSFSAPHVAGALALMLDLFPNISPQNALAALLESADDYVQPNADPITGAIPGAGTDAVGGRGVLNLARAFSPIGATSFDFGGEKVALAEALGPASGALGDWAETSGAFDGLVFQDKFERGFRIANAQLAPARAPFGDFGVRADYARGQARAVEVGPASLSWFNAPKAPYDPRAPWAEAPDPTFSFRYGFADSEVAVGRGGGPDRLTPGLMLVEDASGPPTLGSGDSWTSFAHAFGPLRLDVRSSSGSGRTASGVGLGARGEDWAVRLGYAALKDAHRSLGGTLQMRFGGEDSARLSAIGLEGRKHIGGWTLSGMAEAANARIDDLDVAGLWTSAWSLSAQRGVGGGELRLTAGQPRRAEGGALAFNAPVEVTRNGSIVYEPRIAGLTPSGREIDLETAWSTRLGDLTTFEAAAVLSIQPNHVAAADSETAVWLSLRRAW